MCQIILLKEELNRLWHLPLCQPLRISHLSRKRRYLTGVWWYCGREVVRPTIIKRGFEDTGQYPLSFDSIMDRCYTKVNQIERDAMKATTEVDVYFKTNGNITEEQLDRSNISTIPDANSVPRDQRPLQNQ